MTCFLCIVIINYLNKQTNKQKALRKIIRKHFHVGGPIHNIQLKTKLETKKKVSQRGTEHWTRFLL